MSSTLNKIHVTNSTGLSLNERFTAISSKPKVVPKIGNENQSRRRSRSLQLPITTDVSESSRANQILLAQLQRKHKVQTALKLKRRSMRTIGGGSTGNTAYNRIQRGSVKAYRVGANGKPIRTNSLARIATMKADKEMINNPRPLRRANSSGNLARRLGPRRPTVGGAAQRIAKRKLNRERRRNGGRLFVRGVANGRSVGISNRGRSRSRTRTRNQSGNRRSRSRSRSRNRNPNNQNNRGRSRNRNLNNIANSPAVINGRRANSRSRSRRRGSLANISNLPIKARLGIRPGAKRPQNNRRRSASLTGRGVRTGRIQKRRNSTNTNATVAAVSDNDGRGRIRSRSAIRNNKNGNVRSRTRSRSRTRKGQVGQRNQQGTGQQQRNRAPRGRGQQRRGNSRRGINNNGKAITQQRRGRSRNRAGRIANGGAPRNQGNQPTKTTINKDDLDKELDQYMATTKTENEMDYLLKN